MNFRQEIRFSLTARKALRLRLLLVPGRRVAKKSQSLISDAKFAGQVTPFQ
jgi:hypothetical protein